MGTKNRYRVNLHQGLGEEDLPALPIGLRNDLARYQQVLSLDPVKTRGVPNHALKGNLRNYRALEIDWDGVAYRLSYRVYESPAPRYVQILSFAEHDPAYERAIARKSQ